MPKTFKILSKRQNFKNVITVVLISVIRCTYGLFNIGPFTMLKISTMALTNHQIGNKLTLYALNYLPKTLKHRQNGSISAKSGHTDSD